MFNIELNEYAVGQGKCKAVKGVFYVCPYTHPECISYGKPTTTCALRAIKLRKEHGLVLKIERYPIPL